MASDAGRLIDIGDCALYIVERGDGFPLMLLHGGPGLDHHEFGDYLDALTDSYRLILVDQRSQGQSTSSPESTWTLEQHAKDVGLLASAMGLDTFAVLGHSYGAFVALQNAVDFPGQAVATIVSGGVPSTRYLMEHVEASIAALEPETLRQHIMASWEREQHAQTAEEFASLLHDQMPFHFADVNDPRIAEYERRTADTVFSPDVIRKFAAEDYGGIDVENRLGEVTQPVLVLAGRHDRACSVPAAEAIAAGIPQAELVIFEDSGHMTFVEENEKYVATLRHFLDQHTQV